MTSTLREGIGVRGRGGGGGKNEMLSDVGGGGGVRVASILDIQFLFFLLKTIGFAQ